MSAASVGRRSGACIAALVLVLEARSSAVSAAEPPPKPDAAGQASGDPDIPFPPPSPRELAQPDRSYVYASPQPYPTLPWVLLQAVPSPEVAVGRVKSSASDVASGAAETKTEAAFGLRWQVTPLLWSWGTNRRVSRWRFFVVDPLARHSGSLEVAASFEYFFAHIDRLVVRPGVRAYFPIAQRGEYLSVSLGTSGYAYDGQTRVAYDVGAYVLWGTFGVLATVAPDNGPLTTIGTFRIRFF